MNLLKISQELARNLEGMGYTVYWDALKAAAGAQLPAVVVGVPSDVTLQTKTRAMVNLPVHVLLSTADSNDAFTRLSDSIEFRDDKASVLGALMAAKSNYWVALDVQSISGFTLVTLGANTSALTCEINITVHAIQVDD